MYDDICGITAAMPGVAVPSLPSHLWPADEESGQQRGANQGVFGRRYRGDMSNLTQAQVSFYEYMAHKLVAVGIASNE